MGVYVSSVCVRQEGSVVDYRRDFVERVSPLDRVPEDILLGAFVNGLKDVIKRELRLLDPVSLEQVMEWAKAWVTILLY